MITLENFGANKKIAMRALDVINKQLSHLLSEEAEFSITPQVDDQIIYRMIELEKEVFTIEDNVYSREDIMECLAEEYSLLLLVNLSGKIQGFVYGYDEDADDPVVEGTEYFLDSAVMALAYENKGIGTMLSGVVLLLVYLLGFKKIGITTEVKDKTGRELVKFYKKLGFTEALTGEPGNVGMKVILDENFINGICSKLHISLKD